MALSCEMHTASLYDRGGRKKLADLGNLERVKWERRRDDTSHATVYIGTPGLKCQEALELAESGRVELVVFRGGERVWEGPISRIAYRGSSVEIEARDVMLYVVRTIMRRGYDNRHPNTSSVLDRVKRILTAELARKEALDPPINVLKHIQYLYVQGSRTFPAAYHDITGIRRAIGVADSLVGMEAALEGIRIIYGLTNFGLPSGTSYSGIRWQHARYQDWQVRQYMITAADALSKYPPAFFRTSNINGMFFARNLDLGVGFNVGGAAVNGRLYLDIVDYVAGANVVFGSEHIIHHELAHLFDNNFGTDLIRARWTALNKTGYYGNNWGVPDYGDAINPPGYVRDYSRFNFHEDLADVAGLVMTKSQGPFMDMLTATDPVVKAKVALFKEWMASISSGTIDTDGYFRAMRTGKTVVTKGEDGATDARTAARTLPYELTAFEHIDNFAARGGLDYTVVGRSILFFDVHTRIGQTPMVTKDDFIGDPIITQYGMELATYVAMTDGKGNFGDAGGVDPYYGEWEILHQAYDEDAQGANPEDPPSVEELRSQAQRTYLQGSKPPLVVRVPDNTRLNPEGVLTITDLVPGVWIPLSASLPGRTVSQMQKLDSMTVEEIAGEGEVIKVTMSPAYAEKYVDEE